MTLAVESRAGAVRFRVKVQARARKEEIAGVHAGMLRLRVAAPALEGRANEAVVTLLAGQLRVPRSSIKITAGERSPHKAVEVAGLDAATVLARLGLEPSGATPGNRE
ncbi:MAG: DUF167 domain-containing protein [Candidatus Acidiferrales bacterium]